jgi:hypothetical protein
MSASPPASPQITAGAVARAMALSRTRMPCIWTCMDGWMYMCVCIHPRAITAARRTAPRPTSGPGPAIGKRHLYSPRSPVVARAHVRQIGLGRARPGSGAARVPAIRACAFPQIVHRHAHRGRSGNARRTDPRTLRPEAPARGRWGCGCPRHPVDADERPRCDLSCGSRRDGVAVRALSPCIGVQRQWVRRDGVISCRCRCPGGGGSDTNRNDVGQGFCHAHVGSGGAGA